jgi:hypothetical protein
MQPVAVASRYTDYATPALVKCMKILLPQKNLKFFDFINRKEKQTIFFVRIQNYEWELKDISEITRGRNYTQRPERSKIGGLK